MEKIHVYLAGGMSGLSLEEQIKWRKQIQDAVKYGDYVCNKKPIFFDPTRYYSLYENYHKSEKEVFEFDLSNLRKSDLVIVNFNSEKSIGTAIELGIAHENKIPVIGLNADGKELHPWLVESCMRICNSLKELVDYIVEYFFN